MSKQEWSEKHDNYSLYNIKIDNVLVVTLIHVCENVDKIFSQFSSFPTDKGTRVSIGDRPVRESFLLWVYNRT